MVLSGVGGPILDAWVQSAIFASQYLGDFHHLELNLPHPKSRYVSTNGLNRAR